ncbi:MAG: AraC family transcriptional regulator [Pseudomonadota bacterium]
MTDIIETLSEGFGTDPSAILTPPSVLRGDSTGPMLHAAFFERDFKRPTGCTMRLPEDHAWLSIALDKEYGLHSTIGGRDLFHGKSLPWYTSFIASTDELGAEFNGSYAALSIFIPRSFFGPVLPKSMLDNPMAGPSRGLQKPVTDLLAWRREKDTDNDQGNLAAYGTLLNITSNLVKSLAPADTGERLTPRMVAHVEALMQASVGEPLKVATLASALDLSEAHFARAFRNTTGKTPGEALRQLRMERARDLLEADTLGILDIASEVGYADPSSFAKAFADAYGMTPAKWRKTQNL